MMEWMCWKWTGEKSISDDHLVHIARKGASTACGLTAEEPVSRPHNEFDTCAECAAIEEWLTECDQGRGVGQ
jgi:hypothetical protein